MRQNKCGKQYTVRIARCWKNSGVWVCNRKFAHWMIDLEQIDKPLYELLSKCFPPIYEKVNPDTTRLTVAFVTDENDVSHWHCGWAACDPQDQYSRKFGNAAALARALIAFGDEECAEWIASEGGVPMSVVYHRGQDKSASKPVTAWIRFLRLIGVKSL